MARRAKLMSACQRLPFKAPGLGGPPPADQRGEVVSSSSGVLRSWSEYYLQTGSLNLFDSSANHHPEICIHSFGCLVFPDFLFFSSLPSSLASSLHYIFQGWWLWLESRHRWQASLPSGEGLRSLNFLIFPPLFPFFFSLFFSSNFWPTTFHVWQAFIAASMM